MTITPTTLYWILMLDNFRGLMLGIMLLFIISAFMFTACTFSEIFDGKTDAKFKKGLIKFTLVTYFLITISASAYTLLPSTKQMATIIVAPKLINSNFVQEGLQKEAKELYGMAKSYLKEQLTEPKKEK